MPRALAFEGPDLRHIMYKRAVGVKSRTQGLFINIVNTAYWDTAGRAHGIHIQCSPRKPLVKLQSHTYMHDSISHEFQTFSFIFIRTTRSKHSLPGRLPQFWKFKLERWIVDGSDQPVLNEEMLGRAGRSKKFRHCSRPAASS